MSKKVIFTNLKYSFVTMLSNYNVALFSIQDERAAHKSKVDELNKKLDNIIEARDKAIEEGGVPDEVIEKYSTTEISKALRAEDERFKKACKPYNDNIKLLQKTIPDELYYAYILSTEKGLGSKGKVQVGKSVYVIEKSYKDIVKNFLKQIGAEGQDNETALNKFSEVMAANVAGLRKSSKLSKGYVKNKPTTEYKDLVIRYMLQVLIVEKGVLEMNDDYTLEKVEFDA